ncbi:unnamed protein product, partial [Discosporangium mesarthrocarpum]
TAKVFINVCQHDRVGEMGVAKRLDESGNEVEGFNVPMSVGPPMLGVDKSGAECVIYDVVVNPKVISDCDGDRTGGTRDWVCQLALQWVGKKHKCSLEQRYKLPKARYKGGGGDAVKQQLIRDDSARSQIQEVGVGSSTPSNASLKPPAAPQAKPARPSSTTTSAAAPVPDASPPPLKFKLKGTWTTAVAGTTTTTTTTTTAGTTTARAGTSEDDLSGRLGVVSASGPEAEAEPLLEEVDLTGARLEDSLGVGPAKWPEALALHVAEICPQAVSDVKMKVSAFEVTVEASGHHLLQVPLPHAVRPEHASALACPHTGSIFLTLPVDKTPLHTAPDPGSKPWLLARAI